MSNRNSQKEKIFRNAKEERQERLCATVWALVTGIVTVLILIGLGLQWYLIEHNLCDASQFWADGNPWQSCHISILSLRK
jgi:hypothetical protein